TLPGETPENGRGEPAFARGDGVGVSGGPVVVSGLYPPLDELGADPEQAAADAGTALRPGEAEALRAAARFRVRRQQLQQEQVARLAEGLPLPQLHLPFLFAADLGREQVEELATALAHEIEGLEVAA